MGFQMVTIAEISSIQNELASQSYYSDVYSPSASSIESYQTEPDLLIREYFLSSLEQRYNCRKNIIKYLQKPQYFWAVLRYGARGKYRESYEGAINLLAETDNFSLLKTISLYSEKIYNFLGQQSQINIAENVLEILINAIACAYKINVNDRFFLLVNAIPKINSRMIKASMIDALGLIADEMDLEIIKEEIKKFISDEDQYISDYAQEALQDIE